MTERNRTATGQYGYLDDDDAMLDGNLRVNEPKKDSAWAQQSVPAWYPVRSNGCVVTSFVIIGILLVVLGVLIQSVFNTKVVELEERYDHRVPVDCVGEACHLEVEFTIPQTMEPPIYLYYKLTDYFQNHRLYAQSRQDEQLHGDQVNDLGSCYPLKKWEGKLLYPCGLIANSFFNDTISKIEICPSKDAAECNEAPMRTDGIAWPTDRNDKYHGRPLRDKIETDVGPNGRIPNPGDERMMVWLRVAAMSTFKKLYGYFEHDTFQKGQVVKIPVISNYKATNFKKSLVLSTVSVMGGSQGFLAFFCVIFGVVCVVLSIIFFCINRKIEDDHTRYFFNPEARNSVAQGAE